MHARIRPGWFEGPNLTLSPVIGGLKQPTFVTGAPDGTSRLFVLERGGLVRVAQDGRLRAEPFLDLSHDVSLGGEEGLLGLAFDPHFTTNGYVYVCYTALDWSVQVVRYTVTPDQPDLADRASARPVLVVSKKGKYHNSGMITFGPDQYLYAAALGLLARYGRERGSAVIAGLQPLVAVGHKRLSSNEIAAIGHEGYWDVGGWAELAKVMYARFSTTTGPAVEADGGTFVDLSGAFDAESGTTYADDAVHYTALGQERLAEALAPLVEQRFNFEVGAAEYDPPQVVQPAWHDGDPLPAPVGNFVGSGLPALASGSVSLNFAGLDGARTWLKRNSRLYLGASDGWFALRHGHNRPRALALNQWLAFTLRDPPRQYWLDLGYPLTEHYLAQARNASLAAGARMVVLLIPHDAQMNADKMAAELGRFRLAPDQVDLDRPRRELIDQAARLGCDTIDLLPALNARADRADFTYRHDLHFTPLGHAAVAETVVHELERLGAVTVMLEGIPHAQP